MSIIIRSVRKFLQSSARNGWVHGRDLDVYLRVAKHVVDTAGNYTYTLDVANAVLNRRPSGEYLQMLLGLPKLLQENNDYPKTIYIENVQDEALCPLFIRLGYRRVAFSDKFRQACFFKEVQK